MEQLNLELPTGMRMATPMEQIDKLSLLIHRMVNEKAFEADQCTIDNSAHLLEVVYQQLFDSYEEHYSPEDCDTQLTFTLKGTIDKLKDQLEALQ